MGAHIQNVHSTSVDFLVEYLYIREVALQQPPLLRFWVDSVLEGNEHTSHDHRKFSEFKAYYDCYSYGFSGHFLPATIHPSVKTGCHFVAVL